MRSFNIRFDLMRSNENRSECNKDQKPVFDASMGLQKEKQYYSIHINLIGGNEIQTSSDYAAYTAVDFFRRSQP